MCAAYCRTPRHGYPIVRHWWNRVWECYHLVRIFFQGLLLFLVHMGVRKEKYDVSRKLVQDRGVSCVWDAQSRKSNIGRLSSGARPGVCVVDSCASPTMPPAPAAPPPAPPLTPSAHILCFVPISDNNLVISEC